MRQDDAVSIAIISRYQASIAGLSKYFTGRPCKRGHLYYRNTKNATCLRCASERIRYLHALDPDASPHITVQKNIARSPSRALRRWRKGIRKVSPFADVPAPHALQMPDGSMVMLPAMLDRLRREIDALTGIQNLPPPQPHQTVGEVREKVRMGERRMQSILDYWHLACRPQFGIFGDMTS